MLPFLQKFKPQEAGTSVILRKPDNEESEQNQGLSSCAQALIDAIHAKDAKATAQAFQDMATMCESQPEYSDPEQDSE